MSDFLQDNNQNFSVGFAQGTLGTADIKGTAGVVSGAANPATGAQYVHILGGTSSGGTINAGTINAGTINAGTFSLTPLAGVVLSTGVAIGTTAGTAAIPTTALSSRKSLIAYNVGTTTVYIGGTAVGTAAGVPILPGQYTPSLDIGTTQLFAISAVAAGSMVALEVS